MARKADSSNIQIAKTTLVVPYEIAKARIEARIEIGTDLLRHNIHSNDDLKALDDKYETWSEGNANLLYNIFSDENVRSLYLKSGVFVSSWNPSLGELASRLKSSIGEKRRRLDSVLQSLDDYSESFPQKNGKQETTKAKNNKIFIVHGHDIGVQQKVARVVQKLGLEPIILNEQPVQGRTIIESIEHYGSSVGFAIVLLTPDDEGKAKIEKDLKPRARQNVIFELGYFIAKLGRENVFALREQSVEIPSDYTGVLWVSLDDDWKVKLVKELNESGYDVNANDL